MASRVAVSEDEIFSAWKDGHTMASIADRMGLSRVTVSKIIHRKARQDRVQRAMAGQHWRHKSPLLTPGLSGLLANTLDIAFESAPMGRIADDIVSGELSKQRMLAIPNFGEQCWTELLAWLQSHHVALPPQD